MANTTEGIAELFYARLRTSQSPGVVLAQFYGALFGVDAGRSEIIKCNMLVRIFGKSILFFSMIDLARTESFPEFPYGLLYKICKDKLEGALETDITSSAYDTLDRRLNELRKEMSKVIKIDPAKASKFLDDVKEK